MRTAMHDSKKLRAEILKSTGLLLKKRGAAASVDEIMDAGGLSSGALYSHFKNKDDLCNQAICTALDATLDQYRTTIRERGKAGIEFIIDQYLYEGHVSAVAFGCTFAALGTDMARSSPNAKRAYERRIQTLIEIFADGLGAGTEKVRRAKAQYILSAMLGALTLARAMSSADAVDELLSQTRSHLLRELDAPSEHR